MPDPIFIIGSPRSGTSVLTWALGQHPNISVQPESNWMPTLADGAYAAYQIGTSRQEFTQLSNAEMPLESFMVHFGNAIDAISRECYERRVEIDWPGFRKLSQTPVNAYDPSIGACLIRSPDEPKARWVDGTPEYTFYTYALGLLFPTCKFIHILRRPDQVVNSLAHFQNAGQDAYNRDFDTAIDIWMRHTLAARETARFYGASRVLRIDNEDLLSNGQAVLARCFAFVGEPNCEWATAPLSARLNSSRAATKQAHTVEQIRKRADYLKARDLYEELHNSEVPPEPDKEALGDQKKRLGKPKRLRAPGAAEASAKATSLLSRLLRT